jgi:non-ribosomal peptide synthetase component E (peptide arylation enzyme)
LDSEGWLQVTGRLKEVIIRAGENIAPAEVEQALATHPSIIDVAVIGFPDDRLGERVAAFVTARERFDLDQGRLWLDSVGISRFKMPELIVQMDRLPVLNSGKVDRTDLRARAITAARVRFGHSGSSRP